MEYYNEYLKKIVRPLLGNDTTYLNDLEKVGRKLFGVKFKGVYPCDKIPKLNDLSPYCIANLDNSKQCGSHWIGIAKIHGKNECLVYDSFGRSYKKIIPILGYNGNGKIINTDRDIEQKVLENNCGERSMAWLCVYDKKGYKTAKSI